MKSPNGQYEVRRGQLDEIRMGSPLFGTLEVHGSHLDARGLFGEPLAFSPDSRYLAAEHLIDCASGPHVEAVAFDLVLMRRLVVHEQNPGFVRKFDWITADTLKITVWSHRTGESEVVWQPPTEAITQRSTDHNDSGFSRERVRVVRVLGAFMFLAGAAFIAATLLGTNPGLGFGIAVVVLCGGGLLLMVGAGFRPLQDAVHSFLDKSVGR